VYFPAAAAGLGWESLFRDFSHLSLSFVTQS
jgi:hypothetical protein